MRVGELLRPITAAMGQELLKGDYIQADETPVDVQMHDPGSSWRCTSQERPSQGMQLYLDALAAVDPLFGKSRSGVE